MVRLAATLLMAALLPAAVAEELAAPVIAATIGADGQLWRAVPRKAWLEVDRSIDHGRTFSTPVRVNPSPQKLRASPEDRPVVAADADGRVFVTWAADARQPWTRFIAWSGDGGRSFSAPIPVSDAATDSLQYQTTVQSMGGGKARAIWVDARQQRSGIGSLRMATFDVTRWATPASVEVHDTMCECCRLAPQATAEGASLIFGRLVFGGRIRDMGLITIAADGTASARRVTTDEWAIDACPEHGPGFAIDPGGRHHFTWFTLGTQRQGPFYAYAGADGATHSPPVPLGDRSRLAGHADVGAAGNLVALAWQQYDGRRTSVHAMLSTDNGATWGPARELGGTTGAADYPFILSDGRRLYLSWYATEGGYRLLPLGESGSS